MIPNIRKNMRVGNIKKGVLIELLYLFFRSDYQPMVGAVIATGVVSAAARSKGKL